MITFNVPEGAPTQIIGMGGVNSSTTTYNARWYNGRNVIDLPAHLFILQVKSKNGLKWEQSNPKALRFIADNPGGYGGTPFPDEDSAPASTMPAPIVEPVKVRMKAPSGTTSISFAGEEIRIAADGTLIVTDTVAAELRSHGFLSA